MGNLPQMSGRVKLNNFTKHIRMGNGLPFTKIFNLSKGYNKTLKFKAVQLTIDKMSMFNMEYALVS